MNMRSLLEDLYNIRSCSTDESLSCRLGVRTVDLNTSRAVVLPDMRIFIRRVFPDMRRVGWRACGKISSVFALCHGVSPRVLVDKIQRAVVLRAFDNTVERHV